MAPAQVRGAHTWPDLDQSLNGSKSHVGGQRSSYPCSFVVCRTSRRWPFRQVSNLALEVLAFPVDFVSPLAASLEIEQSSTATLAHIFLASLRLQPSRWCPEREFTIGMRLWWQQDAWCSMVMMPLFSTRFRSTNNGFIGSIPQRVSPQTLRANSRMKTTLTPRTWLGEILALVNTTYAIGAIVAGWFLGGPVVSARFVCALATWDWD